MSTTQPTYRDSGSLIQSQVIPSTTSDGTEIMVPHPDPITTEPDWVFGFWILEDSAYPSDQQQSADGKVDHQHYLPLVYTDYKTIQTLHEVVSGETASAAERTEARGKLAELVDSHLETERQMRRAAELWFSIAAARETAEQERRSTAGAMLTTTSVTLQA